MVEFAEYATGVPCWVDVTSTELERSVAFYAALFGWEAETSPQPEAGGYTMFRLRGKYVAAASPPPPGSPAASYWTTYLASDDVNVTAGKVREAGGTVLMEPFDVFEAGRMTVAQDPAGASFGVWQAGEHIGAQLANEPGTLSWNECHSPDPEQAAAFYAAAFGYTVETAEMGGPAPYRLLQVDGRAVAGLAETRERERPNWMTIFAVADCDAAAAQAAELGGSVVAEPFDIPTVGRFAVLRDPVGAGFGVLAG
jgi:uncharacterized protein